MSKIRVIDLLNKIANGENLPDKIKFDGAIFDLLRFGPIRYTTDNLDLLEDCILEKTDLLEEVEIIEEEPEIDIQNIKGENISFVLCDYDFERGKAKDILNEFFTKNQKYHDTILQALKQLDNQINNK